MFNLRAYPGSEFCVANTLAKWKKLEPNEFNFSQGFSHKVSTSCFVLNSLSAMSRVGVIKIVIVINCNLITFPKVIACNCN